MTPIALVTGGNRGIGFEICRQLGRKGIRVLLTARDSTLGEEATQKLQNEGLDVQFLRLGVTHPEQVRDAYEWIAGQFGRLDILINNAAIYPDDRVSVLNVPLEMVEQTFRINTLGPLNLCQAFVPLMKRNNYGRVVNVSSEMASLSDMGGGTAAYRISKTALNAITVTLAAEVKNYNIKVNSMCPGWVRTRMGGTNARRSPEQGADTVIWLATLPDDGPNGGFFKDRKPIPW